MYRRSPLIIELLSSLSILLLLIGLSHEGVLKKLRPGESLTWGLVQETLEERFEFGAHVLRELHWVFDNKVDQGVDGVCIEGWGTNEKFVNDDSERPEIYCVIVGKFLNKLRCHVKRGTFN
jgi:hypothetical protein